MPLSVLDVYKLLPRSNCGECGRSTCLAFATQVIKEGEDLTRCPYLPEAARPQVAVVQAQQQAGVGRRRESLAIAREALQEKVAPLDFARQAATHGLRWGEEEGRPFILLPFFGQELKVFKDRVVYPPGAHENPWDAILIYNYLASPGEAPVTGRWISFQSLPNSVSKTKTLERLQQQLAADFAGRLAVLRARALDLGGRTVSVGEDADLSLLFEPLPRVPILLLYWEPEEDFPAQARFLFDVSVGAYLDLESLLFLVEGLMERLTPHA
jgi:hypothetical protein